MSSRLSNLWVLLEALEEAWNRGATGQGIRVAVLDTGDFAEQSQLWNPMFSAGEEGSARTSSVTVTDLTDGRQFQSSRTVKVGEPEPPPNGCLLPDC